MATFTLGQTCVGGMDSEPPTPKRRVILFWQSAFRRLFCMDLLISGGPTRCQKCHFYIGEDRGGRGQSGAVFVLPGAVDCR